MAHRSNTDSDCEIQASAQEEVDEQFKNYIAHLTKQLEDLTRLIQGSWHGHQVNCQQTANTSVSFSTTGTPSDTVHA